MKNIVIIFGGRSVEHDISILTGLHASRHVMDGFNVHLVYVTRDNKFLNGNKLSELDFYTDKQRGAKECWFRNGALHKKTFFRSKKVCNVHAVINCCHGGIGEDGRLAALLDIENIPVTSCGFFAAGELMSKSATRQKLMVEGLFPQPKFVTIKKDSWEKDLEMPFDFPVIVKPDKLGSSIGITVARDKNELTAAIELAFTFGNAVIVEEFIQNAREINCAAFRYGGKIWVSKCEVMNKGDNADKEFLDFEKKYLDSGSGFIKKSNQENEEIDAETQIIFDQIQKMVRSAYNVFNAKGVVRCDFLVGEDGKIYLNEINTVPGFLSYHMWAWTGIPYGALLDMLVKQAVQDSKTDEVTVFKSEILQKNRSLIE